MKNKDKRKIEIGLKEKRGIGKKLINKTRKKLELV